MLYRRTEKRILQGGDLCARAGFPQLPQEPPRPKGLPHSPMLLERSSFRTMRVSALRTTKIDFAADVRDHRRAYLGGAMKRYFIFGILVSGVLALALLGWALGAVRWTLTGSSRPDASEGLTPALT